MHLSGDTVVGKHQSMAITAATGPSLSFTTVLQNIIWVAIVTSVMATPAGAETLVGADIAISNEDSELNDWLDRSHRYVTQQLDNSAEWFDHFFRDELSEEEDRAGSVLRWRNNFRTNDNNVVEYSTRAYATMSMPGISRKLRLIVERETVSTSAASLQEAPTVPSEEELNLGLRYDLRNTPNSHFSVSGSVNPSFKARYRYTHSLTQRILARLVETGFWNIDEGWGQTTHLDLEHRLTPATYFRWTNASTYSQSSNGIDWGSEIGWLHRHLPRTAIRFDIGVYGFTDPSLTVKEYVARFRFRRNIHRPWLFYELEPEVSWPSDKGDYQHREFAFTFRLEILFRRH